jgi:L-iditol 2-dehydrogenase
MSFSSRMLAATYTQGGFFAVQEVPVPTMHDDELLLRVTAASICGTDIRIIRNGHRKLKPGQRVILGHEFVGIVERLGVQVEGFKVGERVGIAPNAGCGRCSACLRGKSNYCPEYSAFGIDQDGGHAPWVKIPARFVIQGNVISLPPNISDQEAALLEPFSCVVNGVRTARVELGDRVVIYGAGPIGLMHVMLCRIAGAAKIIVVDPRTDRLEKALSLGCDVAINPQEGSVLDRLRSETDGEGADVVITACSVPEVQSEAVRILAPFGRVCLFGGLSNNVGSVPLDTNAIHYGSLVVTGSTGGCVEDYRTALKLVAERRVCLEQLISDTFPLHDLQRAYDKALSGAEGRIVLVTQRP